MAEKAAGGVQSVERVFELLELITDAGGDVTLSELSSSTDLPLPPSTACCAPWWPAACGS